MPTEPFNDRQTPREDHHSHFATWRSGESFGGGSRSYGRAIRCRARSHAPSHIIGISRDKDHIGTYPQTALLRPYLEKTSRMRRRGTWGWASKRTLGKLEITWDWGQLRSSTMYGSPGINWTKYWVIWDHNIMESSGMIRAQLGSSGII